MPSNDRQRRHRQRDDSRRGHPLQHRAREHRDRDDEGWAERGAWANLDEDTTGWRREGASRSGERDSRRAEGERHRRRENESFVRHVRESVQQADQSTRHSDAAQGFGRSPQGNTQRRTQPDRAPGGRSGTASSQSRGNPRTGSHRETGSGVGSAGQFGDRHGPRLSGSESAGYHGDERHAGQAGRSTRDHTFGSRRGHGSQRREDPRTGHRG